MLHVLELLLLFDEPTTGRIGHVAVITSFEKLCIACLLTMREGGWVGWKGEGRELGYEEGGGDGRGSTFK